MFQKAGWVLAISLMVLTLVLGISHPLPVSAQEDGAKKAQEPTVRRAKTKVQPIYPELARHMSLSGAVRIEVVIAPDGKVKSAKLLGGHPLLGEAAIDAVKRWKYEAAKEETTEIVEFKFAPQD